MRVLIVAKTRRGGGACVGGITWEGQSVRLVAADAARNARAGLEYEVGEVWEVEAVPETQLIPPHVENMVVHRARRLECKVDPAPFIRRHMPPVLGGPEHLFDGLVQVLASGGLFVAHSTGVPARSTMFWVPDKPLHLDSSGKRIRYRYPTSDGGKTLTFVGFQEPLERIPARTLLRVSLAHWWRPPDKPADELRCFLQLSGWFLDGPPPPAARPTQVPDTERRLLTAVPPETGDLRHARQILKETFGFGEFLPLQEEIIRHVLERRDTLVIMPTGGGKSLCYQLPALVFQGLTVVVSPLIALMQDQVSQLRELGAPAAFLNSTLPHQAYVSAAHRVRQGDIKILYVAPETLLRPETLLLLEQSRLACLAVDEAHCISEWGHDFRPEYRQLQPLRTRFPQAVFVALTATATPRVRADIRQLLRIEPEGEFVGSFNRPNLFLAACPRRDGQAQVLAFLDQHPAQSGIIYCSTRQQVEELAAALAAHGRPALPYHAGLPDEVRSQNQERFLRDDEPVMVATVAFGMGINKSNVRFVVHFNLPKDPESYYQEIGRAGRDGLPADCLLLYTRRDAMTIRHFIEQGAASERPGRQARLNALLRYAETPQCRRIPLLAYFGEALPQPCGHCDNCCKTPAAGEPTDVTASAQKFLSCVQRTGERFGPAHIIGVLRGSRSQRILARGHDRLSAFGTGLEYSAAQWRDLARAFIQLGLLVQDVEYGSLRLTPKARSVLRGEKVQVVLAAPAALALPTSERPDRDNQLFQHLRQLRKELAHEAGVPAYIIFSDRALTEMATFLPQNETQFLAVNGVGQAKLAHYGQAFLRCIRDYRQSRGLI